MTLARQWLHMVGFWDGFPGRLVDHVSDEEGLGAAFLVHHRCSSRAQLGDAPWGCSVNPRLFVELCDRVDRRISAGLAPGATTEILFPSGAIMRMIRARDDLERRLARTLSRW